MLLTHVSVPHIYNCLWSIFFFISFHSLFDIYTEPVTTTSSMANDTTAKTTNSTTYDKRNCYEYKMEGYSVADNPIANANKKLPSSSIFNDQKSVLAPKLTEFTSHITFDKLIELIDSEPKRIREWNAISSINTKILMRLCGGGEQGINNGTTGWGSPPSAPSVAAGKQHHISFLLVCVHALQPMCNIITQKYY